MLGRPRGAALAAVQVVLLLGACGSEGDTADDPVGGPLPPQPTHASVGAPDPLAAPAAGTPNPDPTTTAQAPSQMAPGSVPSLPADPQAPSPGDDGTAGAAAPPATDPSLGGDPATGAGECTGGTTDGSDVVMIGDSFFDLSDEITAFLEDYARDAGALPEGASYRHYYRSGTQLVGGFPPSIPSQYDIAKAEGPVRTVIMTGGANDVLIGQPSCGWAPAPDGAACKSTIDDATQAAADLLAEMAADGVEQVVYMFYPHLPPGREGLNTSLDYGYTLARPACEDAAVHCVFIDQREAYAGHPEYFLSDDTHPSTAGSEVSATLIWEAMQAHCIAQ